MHDGSPAPACPINATRHVSPSSRALSRTHDLLSHQDAFDEEGQIQGRVGVGKGAMPVDDDDEDDDEDEVPPPNDDNLLISSTQSVDPQDIDTSCRVRRTTRRGFVSARLSRQSRHREVAMSALTLGPPRSPLLPRNSQGNALMPPHYAATVNKVTRIQRCI